MMNMCIILWATIYCLKWTMYIAGLFCFNDVNQRWWWVQLCYFGSNRRHGLLFLGGSKCSNVTVQILLVVVVVAGACFDSLGCPSFQALSPLGFSFLCSIRYKNALLPFLDPAIHFTLSPCGVILNDSKLVGVSGTPGSVRHNVLGNAS